jgi:hypothetical protein
MPGTARPQNARGGSQRDLFWPDAPALPQLPAAVRVWPKLAASLLEQMQMAPQRYTLGAIFAGLFRKQEMMAYC